MRYHDQEPKRRYVHYLIKNGTYSAEFEATDDNQAKLITKRIHGSNTENVALFRISGHVTTPDGKKSHNKRLKGIQL